METTRAGSTSATLRREGLEHHVQQTSQTTQHHTPPQQGQHPPTQTAIPPPLLDPDDSDSDLGEDCDGAAPQDLTHTDPTTPPPARPVQVGEWLRKVITTRSMDTDHETTTRQMLQARQWGTRVSGGAEAIAIFHLLIEDLWETNLFQKPFAVFRSTNNCVG